MLFDYFHFEKEGEQFVYLLQQKIKRNPAEMLQNYSSAQVLLTFKSNFRHGIGYLKD